MNHLKDEATPQTLVNYQRNWWTLICNLVASANSNLDHRGSRQSTPNQDVSGTTDPKRPRAGQPLTQRINWAQDLLGTVVYSADRNMQARHASHQLLTWVLPPNTSRRKCPAASARACSLSPTSSRWFSSSDTQKEIPINTGNLTQLEVRSHHVI